MEKCPFDLTPYKIGGTTSKPQVFSLNYTNQDFWSMKSRLITYIQENFGNEFNDFVESSLGIMLIENWAFLADTLSFKIDQIANEVFIDTVTELSNAFRLSKLIGYEPQAPTAGKSLWSARLASVYPVDLRITTPYVVDIVNNNVSTTIELFASDPLNRPLFDDDIVITAGQLINSSIVGLQGRTYTDNFTSIGGPNQSYLLAFNPVLMDSIRVYVDGVQYEKVKYFTDSEKRREYRIEFTADYSVYVIFGSTKAGFIPSSGSSIRVVYRVGGGTSGNIVSNFATAEALVPIEGEVYNAVVSLSNYTKGQFGSGGDNIEDIRYKLPIYAESQNRCVSGNDYKNLANLFTTPYNGIMGKANAVLRHSGCSANIIELYVLVKENEYDLIKANSQFKYEFDEYMNSFKMMTDYLVTKDGEIIFVDTNVNVVLDKYYKKFQDEIKSAIITRIQGFFSLNNWDYGKILRDVDIVKTLSDLQQPKRYEIAFITTDPKNSGQQVIARYFEIIRPENIQINFTYE